MNKSIQILSLDGGGIKGIFSAAILAHIEDDLKIDIANYFDLIVGTSTGGIIALGLGIGYSPKQILDYYLTNGLKIFRKNILSKCKHVVGNKYSTFELKSSLISIFGNNCLGDCQKRLVIPSYNLSDDDVYLFKTPHHEKLRRDYKEPLWKVAMATSAAPTYFPTFKEVDNLRLIDGGIWANNPALIGYTEAISLLNVKPENIKILSLGTTSAIKERPLKLDSGGLWQWKNDLTNLLMHSQSLGITNTVKHLIGTEKVIRIDPQVPDNLFELDKFNPDELRALASSISRKVIHEISENFLKHSPHEYKPLYKKEEK